MLKAFVNKLSVPAAVLAACMVILPGPLYKYGIIALSPAFVSLQFGAVLGMLAFMLLLIRLVFFRPHIKLRGTAISVFAIVLAIGFPLSMKSKADAYPPIHDITTDTQTPPQFAAVLKARSNASNPPSYAGDDLAKLQQQGYPDLRSQVFHASATQVKDALEQVIQDFGWELHSPVSEDKLEATETSFWFGFKDDVVVRMTSEGDQTRVDIRSKSRVGRSDLGANAKRIVRLQQSLTEALQ